MLKQFKSFLTTSNALALAIGVIIGAATSKLVTAVVSDLLMPIVSLIVPSGDWRNAQILLRSTTDAKGVVTETAIKYGDLAGTLLDFLIISYVVFLLVKLLLPKAPETPAEPTRACPQCLETVPMAALRCKYCTSPLG